MSDRKRARDLGIHVGVMPAGRLNAITDVKGVRVGHRTLVAGDSVRTGVTVLLPHEGNVYQQKTPAATYVANGFGKLAGSTQVEELGTLETPIVLTNTLSVAAGIEGLLRYTLGLPGNERVRSVNAVVGETNDGFLNDIRGMHVKPEHILEAIAEARSGEVTEGCVGAGTGTSCFGFKGGIGTASRQVLAGIGGYTVGVLVQSNYGGVLTINGVPVGRELAGGRLDDVRDDGRDQGSCMIVIATDAPMSARNLRRLAKRAVSGLTRTGSYLENGSGDYVIAFSTGYQVPADVTRLEPAVSLVTDVTMNPLFQAVVEASEEALYNSMFMATTVTGNEGHTRQAIPLDKVVQLTRRYGLMNLQDRLPGQ